MEEKKEFLERIELREIEEEMKQSYIDYSMSVIISRALPDVRDGLKPVHRRVLYSMYGLGLLHNRAFKKSATVVGSVLGKYHPHGDVAVYDTLVRMAQPFSLRYPLVMGQGNFGSLDGDAAAAYRYTEAKLKRIAEEMLQDIDKKTVKFVPNFDGSENEPTVLPAKIPNLLINGSSGIAVGMATNMPPHNLVEVCDGVIALIENPEMGADELMNYVKGPDFPTGAIVYKGGIEQAYRYGRGKLVVRAKTETEEEKGRKSIIIKEIPYMVNKAMLVEEMANLVKEKKVIGITDIRDESDREGIRVVLELKTGMNPDVVLNQLYKHSRMQTTFGVIMLALVGNQPKVLNLKQLMEHFISHRQEVVRKRTEFDLKKAEDRAHILEGLIVALKNIDEVVRKIKASKTVGEAEKMLMHDYSLTKIQAQAILDMKLQKLASLEQENIRKEYEELLKLIERLKEILADEKRILGIIRKELEDIKERYGDKRRTEIVEGGEVEIEVKDLIKKEDMVVTVSHAGYIKRLPISSYKEQRRGGKGVIAAGTREEDFLEDIFVANTHDMLLFFTSKGKAHWLNVYTIPEGSRQAKGNSIANLLNLEEGEKVTAYIPTKGFNEGYLVMATKKGVIKKVSLEEFSRPRKGGIIAVNLRDNDELINAVRTDGKQQIILATRNGMANKFNEGQVRAMGRNATGVRGISLRDNDEVVGMVLGEDNKTLLTITENGYGKRTRISEYRLTNRGSIGVKNIICSERNGKVVEIRQVDEQDDLMLISQKGIAIRTPISGVSVIGRNTQGVRIMKLENGDKVVGAAKMVREEQEKEIEEKEGEEIERIDEEIEEGIIKQEEEKKGFFRKLFGI